MDCARFSIARSTVLVLALTLITSNSLAQDHVQLARDYTSWAFVANYWYNNDWPPLLNDITTGMRSLERDQVVSGTQLFADYLPRHRAASDLYFSHMDDYYGDDGLARRLAEASGGTDSTVSYLEQIAYATRGRNDAVFALLSALRDGGTTVTEVRLSLQIVELWEVQRRTWNIIYLNAR